MLLLFRKTQTIVIFFHIYRQHQFIYAVYLHTDNKSYFDYAWMIVLPVENYRWSVFYSQLDILRRVLFNKYYWWPFFIWQVWSAFVKQQGFALCTKTITLNRGIFFQNCRSRRLLIGWHFFVIKVLAGLKGAELSLYLFLFCCVKHLKIICWFRLQNP